MTSQPSELCIDGREARVFPEEGFGKFKSLRTFFAKVRVDFMPTPNGVGSALNATVNIKTEKLEKLRFWALALRRDLRSRVNLTERREGGEYTTSWFKKDRSFLTQALVSFTVFTLKGRLPLHLLP